MHLLHTMCQAVLNPTFRRGQLFHNHPSAVGPWNITSQQSPNTHFKTAQGFLYLPEPLQMQEAAAAAFSMWTGKQSLQSTVLLQS